MIWCYPWEEDIGWHLSHANDCKILNRLRRAHGHLSTIISMVEQGREGLKPRSRCKR
ncbi:metal-sensing transcriptional repressor [Sphingomonas sp. AAP5]|uniref:metal-sensing transcriptional repressor n=1 Tax=Sphingomonas sp. AAP5 TaxID=1523415 RepID=UPI003FA6BFE2